MEDKSSAVAESGSAAGAPSGSELSGAFTPGPWVVWSSIYEGMVAQVRSTDMHERPIAEVRKHRNGYRDALLMAAAPDLLEASVPSDLEDAADIVERENSFLAGELRRQAKKQRAAIAKAEGRQP